MTEIVPTFSSWKREQKKLRAVSDTQPEDILVIKLRDITFAYAVSLSRKLKSLKVPKSLSFLAMLILFVLRNLAFCNVCKTIVLVVL